MKIVGIILAVFVGLAVSIMPLSVLMVKQGFKHQDKPWAPKAVFAGARIRMRLFQYRGPRAVMEKALTTWPKYEKRDRATFWIAMCYEKSGQNAQALAWYKKFLAQWPSHEWADQARRRIANMEANAL